MASQKITAFFEKFPTVNLAKDQIIFHYRQSADYIYLVKSGFITCDSIFSQPEKSFPLTISSPGDIIPLTSIASANNKYPLRHIFCAITPTILYEAPLKQFREFVQKDQSVYYYLQQKIAKILYNLINHLEILLNNSAEEKVMNILFYLFNNFSKKTKDGYILQFPLTHKKLASFCNLSRETTTKVVDKLLQQKKFQYQNHFFLSSKCDFDYKTHH